ncbi:MAG: NAD(P)/FAD-dependent oxidoreductase [Chitinivibrionales bacterium]|nr:NAD(P)/FAD-dependent oxidoreductase [Chitinivibrionales bacterium]
MTAKAIVIIGNGVAGTTLAREVRKRSDAKITVISEEYPYFYSRPALMYLYMGMLSISDVKPYEDWFWAKNRIDLIHRRAQQIDIENHDVELDNGASVHYDTLVIATGSRWNKFGWPGQELKGVVGMTHLSDIQELEELSADAKEAVIVGGGLIGVEMAEMLLSRGMHVTFLVRKDRYWAAILTKQEAALVGRHLQEHGVKLLFSTELHEILSDDAGRVRAVRTNKDEEIPCTLVALTAGVHPVIDLVRDSPVETQKGILVDNSFATNIPGIYAIGDCAQFRNPLPQRKKIEQLWYTAKMHGATLAHILTGETKTYQPGIFFNSAKFFDIEYQTYGVAPSETPDDEESFYWEAPSGNRSLRINFDKQERYVKSFTLLGLRTRHAVAEYWIAGHTPINDVIADIGAFDFDAEFSPRYQQMIVDAFCAAYPEERVALRTRKGLFTPFLRNLFNPAMHKE